LSLLLAPALLSAASTPLTPETEPVDLALRRARAEAQAADAEARKYQEAAKAARDEAGRLQARQAAAAQQIAAAEARISAAETEAKIAGARLAAKRAELAAKQAPAASLLAGLAMMAERPPLLAVADSGSVEELVHVRLLLESTLPEIRRRTAALSAELQSGQQLQRQALAARDRLRASRDELARRKIEFAQLEASVLKLADKSGNAALSSGDLALARTEQAEQLERQAGSRQAVARIASEVASLGLPPPRPFAPDGRRQPPPWLTCCPPMRPSSLVWVRSTRAACARAESSLRPAAAPPCSPPRPAPSASRDRSASTTESSSSNMAMAISPCSSTSPRLSRGGAGWRSDR
jgi:hypothetical protein